MPEAAKRLWGTAGTGTRLPLSIATGSLSHSQQWPCPTLSQILHPVSVRAGDISPACLLTLISAPPHPRKQGPTPTLSHLPRDFPPLFSAPLLGPSLCWPTSQQVDMLKSFLCTKLHTHTQTKATPQLSRQVLATGFSLPVSPSTHSQASEARPKLGCILSSSVIPSINFHPYAPVKRFSPRSP